MLIPKNELYSICAVLFLLSLPLTFTEYAEAQFAEVPEDGFAVMINICADSNIFKKYQSWMGKEIERGTAKDGGKFRHYKNNASIFCHNNSGIHEIHGAIRIKWQGMGWENSYLGYPISDEEKSFDDKIRWSNFQGGVICWTSENGAFDVKGSGQKSCQQELETYTPIPIDPLRASTAHLVKTIEPAIYFDKTTYYALDTIYLKIVDSTAEETIRIDYRILDLNGNVIEKYSLSIMETAPDSQIFEIGITVDPKWANEYTQFNLLYYSPGYQKQVSNYIILSPQVLKLTKSFPPQQKIYWKPTIDTKIFDLAISAEPKVYAASKLIPYNEATNEARVIVEFDSLDIKELRNISTIETSRPGQAQITIEVDKLGQLSDLMGLRSVYAPIPLQQHQVISEGVRTLGAEEARNQGITGENIKIAILDKAFDITNSEIAANVKQVEQFRRDFGGNFVNPIGIGDEAKHGTSVAEVIVDIAPAVDLYLYTIETELEFRDAIDHILTTDIDIITMSAGYIQYLADGQSRVTKKLTEAAIEKTVIISAGNYRLAHWQGSLSDFLQDVNSLKLTINSQRTYPIIVGLLWTNPTEDFNLILKDPTGNQVDLSSNNQLNGYPSNSEIISYVPVALGDYHLEVSYAGPNDSPSSTLEIFSSTEGRFATFTPLSSSTAPTDADDIITVGAINYQNYRVEEFSSEGPTENGQTVPTVVGPDSVMTSSFNEQPFMGTSAATPHIAGLAALFLQQNPTLSTEQLRNQLLINANRDMIPESSSNNVGYGLPNADSILNTEGPTTTEGRLNILEWIKELTKWWLNNEISEREFIDGIQHLIKNHIIVVPDLPRNTSPSDQMIPNWIKNNAQWWVDDKISDTEFVNGLTYLIKEGIIIILDE
jgi:subtilisin family serine protease